MANVLTDIMPKILSRGLLVLREQAVMPRLVNGDYSAEAAEKGDTIDVPISTAVTATAVVPGPTPPADVDTTPGKVQIPLDQWFEGAFHLTDKEMVEVDQNRHFLPLQSAEAIRALANQVNGHIHSQYKGIYGYAGVAATTPFGTDASEAIDARKVLHQQRAFRDNRRGVLDFDAEASALALATFADAEKTGESGVKIEGEIGRKYGFDWVSDDQVATHTAGTTTGTVTVTGANAIGAKTINLTTAAASAVDALEGDIVTFVGDTQTYVITADATIAASTTGNILIEPGLVIATVGAEVPTIKATHVVNLAFHRDAFAFANRPLVASTQGMQLGNLMLALQDPQTGIALRLEVSRQHKQVKWSYDLLWGSKLVRPGLATRIAG